MNQEAIPVYGDGMNVRDWIYVEDHCRAILAAMEKGRSGAVYNIGARNEQRNIEVAESLLDALDKPRSLIKFVKDRPGHDRRYAIDPSLVESELGWRPRETWATGLKKLSSGIAITDRGSKKSEISPIETTTKRSTELRSQSIENSRNRGEWVGRTRDGRRVFDHRRRGSRLRSQDA